MEALKEWKKTQTMKPFKKDPNRPKRGLSAYLIFVNEQRPRLTKEGFEMLEVSKECGKLWAKMGDAANAPYEKKAAKSKADAEKALEKYKNSKNYKSYMAEKAEYDARKQAAKKTGDEKPKAVTKK